MLAHLFFSEGKRSAADEVRGVIGKEREPAFQPFFGPRFFKIGLCFGDGLALSIQRLFSARVSQGRD